MSIIIHVRQKGTAGGAEMMTKKQMAREIAEKWERESKLNLGVEWRVNDLMKRYGWSDLRDLYEREIG